MTPRMLADSLGLLTYNGGACSKCGGVSRYVSNRTCVVCDNRTSRERYKANPGHCNAIAKRWRKNNREYIKLYKMAREELRNEQRI